MNEFGNVLLTEDDEQESPEFAFATVASVTASGITLQFDGEDEASSKPYRCNAAQRFLAGDRVKIHKDSGSYVVEYVVGAPSERYPVPTGGSTGQVLTKSSGNNYDMKWAEAPNGLPSGGSAGQYLQKTSSGSTWASPSEVPSGGSTGQVLTKTASSFGWADASSALPSGGSTGQVLQKTASGASWATLPVSGSSSTIGFMGSSARSKQTVSNLTTPSTATASTIATKLNDLLTALRNYGLIG